MTHRNDLVPSDAATITPSDTGGGNYCGFCVSVSGDVKIKTAKGNDVTFSDWPAGAVVPLAFTRVYLTGTTATGIIGFIA